MNSRNIVDAMKKETGNGTDRSLAEKMGVKYPTFANWITRDSLQFDIILPFLIEQGVDLNRVFSTAVMDPSAAINEEVSEFQQLSDEVKQKCEEYRDFGGKKMIESFKADLEEMIKRYDKILTGIQAQIADYLKERNK